LFKEYDYATLDFDMMVEDIVVKVSSGGKVIDGEYVGGKWGHLMIFYGKWSESPEDVLKYDYVGDALTTVTSFEAGELYDRTLMSEVSNGGYFNKEGTYIGKYGLYGYWQNEDVEDYLEEFEEKLLLDFQYDYIEEAGLRSAIVGYNGNRLDTDRYIDGKYGVVEYITGKVIIPPIYDSISAYGWIGNDYMDYWVESPYGVCSNGGKYDEDGFYKGGKWGIVNVKTGEEILPVEYSLNEMNKQVKKLEEKWLEEFSVSN